MQKLLGTLKGLAVPKGAGITITSGWFGYDHINMGSERKRIAACLLSNACL